MKIAVMLFYETGSDLEVVQAKFKDMVSTLSVVKEIEEFKAGLSSWLPGMDAMSAQYEVK